MMDGNYLTFEPKNNNKFYSLRFIDQNRRITVIRRFLEITHVKKLIISEENNL